MKSLLLGFFLIMVLGFTFTGFVIGGLDEALSGVGCGRASIASYSPGYWLGCETFRKRWERDMIEREERAAKKKETTHESTSN